MSYWSFSKFSHSLGKR